MVAISADQPVHQGAVQPGALDWRDELQRLTKVANHLRRELTFAELRSGQWFERLVRVLLAHHARHARARGATAVERSDEQRAIQAQHVIQRASFEAAALGVTSAAITTAASMLTAESEGLAGVVALPVAAFAVAGDTVLRSIMHVGMCCDLADAYAIPFPERAAPEIVALCALALLGDGPHHEDELGREGLSHTADADAELAAKALGSQLFGETLSRDAIPFLGIVASGLSSYFITRKLGRFVREYVMHRRALARVLRPLCEQHPEAEELLLEGLWFVFTADGRLTREETAVLGGLLAIRGDHRSGEMFDRFVADEAAWLDKIRAFAPGEPSVRAQFFQAFELAAVFSHLAPGARPILEHAAHALGCSFNPAELERLADVTRRGIVPTTIAS